MFSKRDINFWFWFPWVAGGVACLLMLGVGIGIGWLIWA